MAAAMGKRWWRARYEGDVHCPLLTGNFIVSGSNCLFERDAFDAAGEFDDRLRRLEDWELHARLAKKHSVRIVRLGGGRLPQVPQFV